MTEEPKPANYWGLTLLIAIPILIILALLITFVGGPLHNLWFNYFWSSDKGNGPEALQQTVLYALIAAVLIPVVRHFIKREFEKVHKHFEDAHEEIHEHLHHVCDQMGLERFERKKK